MRLLTIAMLLSLAGCGSDEGQPFVLIIASKDVELAAIDRIFVVLEAGELNRSFRMVPDDDSFAGTVKTRVSGGGEFVIELTQSYVAGRAESTESPEDGVFTLELPLETRATDDATVSDPNVTVTFLEGADSIAIGAGTLSWPIADDGTATINVRCLDGVEDRCAPAGP